jgi:hypothetical protein
MRDHQAENRRNNVNITVIDGQGGHIGAQLVKEITERFSGHTVTAVGTNAVAAATMLKAGADHAASGENPVIVACRKADVIIGPIGIVIADSLYGEVTPEMALAVGQSNAVRILIPMNKCDNLIAGFGDVKVNLLIEDVMVKLEGLLKG